MAKWRGTVEYTPVLTGKRVWEIIEVEAPTLESAIQKALLKTGIGPIRRQLTHVKVDITQIPPSTARYDPEEVHTVTYSQLSKGERRCGSDLLEWLRDKGLSLSDINDVIAGIPDFQSTTLALDEHGLIVDYDQYYADPEYVKVHWGRAIWERIRKIGVVDRLLIFNNVSPNCLEYHGTISPYQ